MRKKEKKIIKKAILYRIFSFSIGQILTFVVLRRIEINALVAFVDFIQTVGYFFFEEAWERKK